MTVLLKLDNTRCVNSRVKVQFARTLYITVIVSGLTLSHARRKTCASRFGLHNFVVLPGESASMEICEFAY